jgi:large subunit ribosomal protein L21e
LFPREFSKEQSLCASEPPAVTYINEKPGLADGIIHMVRRPRGPRNKTRHKLSKSPRIKGAISVSKSVKVFPIGTLVAIKVDPSFHKGLPPGIFHGLTGRVVERRGKTGYIVEFKMGRKTKRVVTTPAHLRELGGSSVQNKA